GERLHHLVSPEAYRAASALLCLTPGTPLLFMGQEWAASAPFLYFTDHHAELGRQVTQGRAREFEAFLEKIHRRDPAAILPDPQEEETFLRSKLCWNEIRLPQHARILELYRELLRLRRTTPAIASRSRDTVRSDILGKSVAGLAFYENGRPSVLLVVCLQGGGRRDPAEKPFASLPRGERWRPVLSTNEPRFGGTGSAVLESEA